MLKFFDKNPLSGILALILLNTMSSSAVAEEFYYPSTYGEYQTEECCYAPAEECCYPTICCDDPCNRFYIGGFGGELFSNRQTMTQTGTAFFLEDLGGPLAVDARGRSNKTTSGFGGVQIGYEWTKSPCLGRCSSWNIAPAFEFEAYWYTHTKKGDLLNPTTRLEEHDFFDTFPMRMGVYMFNGVFALNNCWFRCLSPYVGGGVGFAHISIHGADSLQVDPPEVGVNHFDSDRDDRSFAFAAQAKVGLRYNIWKCVSIFGEYRFLYVDSSRYIFGSTVAPGHAATSTWDVEIKGICYNAFAFGLQFDL